MSSSGAIPGPAGGPGRRSPRTITKKELVARIAEKTNQTKVVAKDIIQLFLDEIIRELGNGNRLEFREFGVFEIKERAARKAQNPRTLEKVSVPAKRVVKFKVGRLMKERVARTPPERHGGNDRPAPGAQGGGGGSSSPR
jgi:integration host factor subunit beta